MKAVSLFSAGLLVAGLTAWAQDKPQATPSSDPANQTPSQTPSQAEPAAPSQPALPPAASSSKTVSGTVESITEGKSLKVKTAAGKSKTFNLRDAAVDSSVKVGSSVRVTQSRDVNGKSSIVVEPDSADKH